MVKYSNEKICYTISLSIFMHNLHCHNLRSTWNPWNQIFTVLSIPSPQKYTYLCDPSPYKISHSYDIFCTANKHNIYRDFDESPCFAFYTRTSVKKAAFFFKSVSPHYAFPNWKACLLILHSWHIRITDVTGGKNLQWIWLQHAMCNRVTRRCG